MTQSVDEFVDEVIKERQSPVDRFVEEEQLSGIPPVDQFVMKHPKGSAGELAGEGKSWFKMTDRRFHYYRITYTPGPGDIAWMEEGDILYIKHIVKEAASRWLTEEELQDINYMQNKVPEAKSDLRKLQQQRIQEQEQEALARFATTEISICHFCLAVGLGVTDQLK